tara:strand:- start:462 stop:1031 length:570 start_codon:yes stop_codon:yes gene_type:complete
MPTNSPDVGATGYIISELAKMVIEHTQNPKGSSQYSIVSFSKEYRDLINNFEVVPEMAMTATRNSSGAITYSISYITSAEALWCTWKNVEKKFVPWETVTFNSTEQASAFATGFIYRNCRDRFRNGYFDVVVFETKTIENIFLYDGTHWVLPLDDYKNCYGNIKDAFPVGRHQIKNNDDMKTVIRIMNV